MGRHPRPVPVQDPREAYRTRVRFVKRFFQEAIDFVRDGALRVVGGTYERTALDVPETDRTGRDPVALELIGWDPARDREVRSRSAAGTARASTMSHPTPRRSLSTEDLVLGLAETDHEARTS